VKNKGFTPIGIKTDCILINESRREIDDCIDFIDVVGGLKFEKDKALIDHSLKQTFNDNEQYNFTINEIPILDECDTGAINAVFDSHPRVFVKGILPGVGKTTTVTKYTGHKILIVCPFNTLCQELKSQGHTAITLNELLAIRVDAQQYCKSTPYNVSEFDVICFDEILLYDPFKLKQIDNFMKQYKEKKFIATGDTDQLEPIQMQINNVQDQKKYLNSCIAIMFPDQFTLKVNKRLKSEEDRQKLINLKSEIFDTSNNVIELLKKYGFKTIDKIWEVKTLDNIAFFNFRCQQVNNRLHKTMVVKPTQTIMIDKNEYYQGLHLICKSHYKMKTGKLFRNFKYEIMNITDTHFVVRDITDNHTFKLENKLMSFFRLPYVRTTHSVQGLSIKNKITIFDCNTPHVSRNWIWTAITRATDLNNVQIYVHKEEEVSRLTESKKNLYFSMKIEGYKGQDKLARRSFDTKKFVDVKWINEELKVSNLCKFCRAPFETYVDENHFVQSNLTVDRINSLLPHEKCNSQLLCHHCNISKKQY